MISICHINITSITKHKDELLARFSKYDIISVNETNLKSERPFSLKGYNVFRNDRVGKDGGGVLLAVKQHIKCQEIINKTTDKNELIAVQLSMQSYKPILVASIYVPPAVKLSVDAFHEVYNMNNNCIIVGDLNAALFQMGSRKTNTKGRQLQELINEGFLNCVDDDSTTFEKNDYEEKLDWILASQPLFTFISNVETHPTLGLLNGHKPLTFDIPFGAESKPASPRISFNFKAAEWSKYRKKLDEQLKLWKKTRPSQPTDIEEYAAFITTSIIAATQDTIPTATKTNTNLKLSEANTTSNQVETSHLSTVEEDRRTYRQATIL